MCIIPVVCSILAFPGEEAGEEEISAALRTRARRHALGAPTRRHTYLAAATHHVRTLRTLWRPVCAARAWAAAKLARARVALLPPMTFDPGLPRPVAALDTDATASPSVSFGGWVGALYGLSIRGVVASNNAQRTPLNYTCMGRRSQQQLIPRMSPCSGALPWWWVWLIVALDLHSATPCLSPPADAKHIPAAAISNRVQ